MPGHFLTGQPLESFPDPYSLLIYTYADGTSVKHSIVLHFFEMMVGGVTGAWSCGEPGGH